jgi:hypothetical protein
LREPVSSAHNIVVHDQPPPPRRAEDRRKRTMQPTQMPIQPPIDDSDQALQLAQLLAHPGLVGAEVGALAVHDFFEAGVGEPLFAVEDDVCKKVRIGGEEERRRGRNASQLETARRRGEKRKREEKRTKR